MGWTPSNTPIRLTVSGEVRAEMSVQTLIDAAKAIDNLTDEEFAERAKMMRKRMAEYEREITERHRCASCGADTLKHSHAFDCKWRGF